MKESRVGLSSKSTVLTSPFSTPLGSVGREGAGVETRGTS